MAIAICASGNYLAGTIWPIVMRQLLKTGDWRRAYVIIGVTCMVVMLPLALVLIRRAPSEEDKIRSRWRRGGRRAVSMASCRDVLFRTVLIMAGLACCVAMSMPQVHIVAYCVDLDFGVPGGRRCCR